MLNQTLLGVLSFTFFLQLSTQQAFAKAVSVDTDLAKSLKMEANHDLTRLKSLKSEKSNQKIYDNEREKGLASFLEEQEKWDLSRERGLGEYRKQKKQISPQEGGPEYLADQKEKNADAIEMEASRSTQVRTKNQVYDQNKDLISELETEELGLNQSRPRYSLRKRGQNRWVKGGASGSSGGSSARSSAPSYSAPPPPVFDDFPPPPVTDYQPVPSPMDGFEEIPPPPSPVYEPYGNAGTPFDSGFGDIPPPPPPPPLDYDF